VNALNNKNKERASICANEVAEVRKLIHFFYNVELAIERVILRLETVKELSDIVGDLKPALKLLQNVSQELFNVLPDVSSELTKVNETITETLCETRLTTDETAIPVDRKTPGGEEILNEVSGILARDIAKKLPEPPATPKTTESQQTTVKEMVALTACCSKMTGKETEDDTKADPSQTLFSYKKAEFKEISLTVEKPSLEDVLLDYVKKSHGEIDLIRCSDDLKIPNEEIEKTLETLGTKGKIKIELKTSD
jgi:hypothetical protein